MLLRLLVALAGRPTSEHTDSRNTPSIMLPHRALGLHMLKDMGRPCSSSLSLSPAGHDTRLSGSFAAQQWRTWRFRPSAAWGRPRRRPPPTQSCLAVRPPQPPPTWRGLRTLATSCCANKTASQQSPHTLPLPCLQGSGLRLREATCSDLDALAAIEAASRPGGNWGRGAIMVSLAAVLLVILTSPAALPYALCGSALIASNLPAQALALQPRIRRQSWSGPVPLCC